MSKQHCVVFVLPLFLSLGCGAVVETPSGDGSGGQGAGSGVKEPSMCRAFTSEEACCAVPETEVTCAWLDPQGDFKGVCLAPYTEDCTLKRNKCPAGQHCFIIKGTGPTGECRNYYDSLTEMGICVDD